MDLKFYYCEDCENIVILVKDSGVPFKCCGHPMAELLPGTGDGSRDRHTPVWHADKMQVHVTVGTEEHPMEQGHFIEWIALKTRQTVLCKFLTPGNPPEVSFALCEEDDVEAVYAFCNLHGLWAARQNS